MAEMKHEADASEKEENGTKNVFENAMRLNLVFYGEDKTVIYETSHSSRERERNNRPACLSTQWTEFWGRTINGRPLSLQEFSSV